MPTCRRGFSVVELLVVLTVLAVLMTITGARFIAFRDEAAVRAATGEALHAFSLARTAAVARRAAVAVRLDTAAGTIMVEIPGRVLHWRALRSVHGVSL